MSIFHSHKNYVKQMDFCQIQIILCIVSNCESRYYSPSAVWLFRKGHIFMVLDGSSRVENLISWVIKIHNMMVFMQPVSKASLQFCFLSGSCWSYIVMELLSFTFTLTILGQNNSQILMRRSIEVKQKAWSICCQESKSNVFLGYGCTHINGRRCRTCIFSYRIRFLECVGNRSVCFKHCRDF